MDLKEAAARAAIALIENQSIVGLGDGSTISHLVKLLLPVLKSNANLQLITSSVTTEQLLHAHELQALSVQQCGHIDIYFDGCDQVDRQLNALKSGGGIHTMEKLLASMADQFVLVGDSTKLVDQFDLHLPVVLEVLPQAAGYVANYVHGHLPLKNTSFRYNGNEYRTTANGNYLLDLWFNEWPNLERLDKNLKQLTGVVESSLFYQLAHKAVIAGSNGVMILERG